MASRSGELRHEEIQSPAVYMKACLVSNWFFFSFRGQDVGREKIHNKGIIGYLWRRKLFEHVISWFFYCVQKEESALCEKGPLGDFNEKILTNVNFKNLT